MSDPILVVDGLCKHFGGRVALEGATLAVQPGSITGVIGPNGSGKSTLFNIIAGSLRPDSGRVTIGGAEVTGASPAAICRAGVGRTFQISRLFGEMTVLENLVAVAHGVNDREAVDRALGLLAFLEIDELANRWGSELSYGQRKLVEIARALMQQPRVLLLDEPFAGINPRLQNAIVGHLEALRTQGMTVFFIDHEMRIVLSACDAVHVLAEGKAGLSAIILDEPSLGLSARYVELTFQALLALRDAGLTVIMVEQKATRALAVADRGYVMHLGQVAFHGEGGVLLADEKVKRLFLGLPPELGT